MNYLTMAIQHVRNIIPEEILEAAFLDHKYFQRNLSYSLDAMIRSDVFNHKVAIDINAVSGTQILIPLGAVPFEVVDNVNCIMRIPKDLTQGRNITTVLSVGLADNYSPAAFMNPGQNVPVSAFLQATSSVVNSVLPVTQVSTNRVRLIGENTIMINDSVNNITFCYLRCVIEHDSEMNTLQAASFPVFRDLFALAVKSVIYNKLIIKMGKTVLLGGMELGVFKEVVDEYRESEALYQELLINKWIKTSILNDPEARRRHLTLVGTLI